MADQVLRTIVITTKYDGSGMAVARTEVQKFSNEASKGLNSVQDPGQKLTGILEQVGGKLQGVVPGAGILSKGMGELGDMTSSAGAGMTGLLGGLGVVTVALTAAAMAAKASIASFQEYVGGIHEIEEVSGASAEESSQLAYIFGAVGLSSDQAANAIFRMNKLIEQSPQKFEAAGITIARTKDGNVDLGKTLESVHAAYQAAGSAAERDTILFTAFGRSGRDLIDVMELTNEQFDALKKRSPIFNDRDLAMAKQFARDTNELKMQWDATMASFGEGLVEGILPTIDMLRDLDKAIRDATGGIGGLELVSKALTSLVPVFLIGQIYDLVSGNKQTREAALKAAQALKDQKQAAEEDANAIKDLNRALDSMLGNQISVDRANRNVADSTNTVAQKQEALNAAIASGDPAKIAAARRELADANTDLEASIDQAALAAQRQYITEETAKTGTYDAEEAHNVYIGTLQRFASTLAPGSEARVYIEQMIAKENEMSRDRHMQVTIGVDIATAENRLSAFQHWLDTHPASLPVSPFLRGGEVPGFGGYQQEGGRTVPGKIYVVGEKAPELWFPDTYGRTVPLAATPSTALAETGADNRDLLRDIRDQNRQLLELMAAPAPSGPGTDALVGALLDRVERARRRGARGTFA